jgi:hypothetical protein
MITSRKIITVFLLLVVLILTQNQISLAHSPGQLNACAIGNGAFNLRYVPGPTGFPTGTDDSGICTAVNYGYWMVDTEVTYNLWAIVRDWATSADLGPAGISSKILGWWAMGPEPGLPTGIL